LTSDGLAQILSQLFLPDTVAVKRATALLKVYFKKVVALEQLLMLMSTGAEQNLRQIACVYLRKIIANLWGNLAAENQAKTKALLLERFI
jgi:hypothetical protein